jgi:hypothetical protein
MNLLFENGGVPMDYRGYGKQVPPNVQLTVKVTKATRLMKSGKLLHDGTMYIIASITDIEVIGGHVFVTLKAKPTAEETRKCKDVKFA